MNPRSGVWVLALLVGAVVALWLRFQPLSADESGYVMEMDLAASANGETWLRYDIGDGLSYRDQRIFSVVESAQPRTYRVALPSGVFQSFAIIPPNSIRQTLAGARILAPDGTPVARIPALPDTADRNIISFAPQRPLELLSPDEKSGWESGLEFILCAGVVLLVDKLARRRAGPALRVRRFSVGSSTAAWAGAHPRTTLLLAAALAVATSCHPVLFFGKSFVSPNNGVLCLYDVYPTVPGAPAQPFDSWHGSDINATMWAHLTYSVAAHDAIWRDHELPLWNRYVMCGLTLLGQGQSMIGDPLYLLTVAANGASWAWDLRFLLSKLIFCLGVGFVVWKTVRHLGVAALLAFSSAFIGFFSFRFDHPAFFSVCYAPWMLFCWLQIAGAPTIRRADWWALALIAANWLELNSGTAKEASMLLIGLNGAGALALLLGSESRSMLGKKLALAGASCAAFLAVSAPLWMVFLDALHRGYTIYDTPLTNQLSPGLLVGLFDDLFFRQLMDREWHVDPALNFLALLGLCWAVVDPRSWWRNTAAKALAAVSVLGLAMIFGVIPPACIDRLPLLKNISHVDDVFICVLIVPLFVLAGFGLRTCVEGMRAPEAWLRNWRNTLLVLGGLAALYCGTVHAVPHAQDFGLQLTRPASFGAFFSGYALALFAAVALLPWSMRWLVAGRGSRAVHVLVILLCLVAIHFRHGLWLETKFARHVDTPRQRVDLQAASPAVDYVRAHQMEPSRAVGFGLILRPGFNTVLRLEGPFGADAVTMRSLAEYYEAAGLGGQSMWWPTVTKANIGASQRFYDAMNVRYYFGSAADAAQPAPGLEKVAGADLDVFESKTAWPRAFFTDRLTRYQDVRQLANGLKKGDGRPFAAVLVNEANAPAAPLDQAARQIVAARDYRLTGNTTSFTVDAPGTGVAVLNESYVPDNFRAYVDGRRVPWFRVNHLFKGVALPGPGTHHVRFEYWPQVLTMSLWVAAGGLLLILASMGALWLAPGAPGKNVMSTKAAPWQTSDPVSSGSP